MTSSSQSRSPRGWFYLVFESSHVSCKSDHACRNYNDAFSDFVQGTSVDDNGVNGQGEQWRRTVQHPNNREEALGLVVARHSSISILWRTRWMLGTTRLPGSPLIGIPSWADEEYIDIFAAVQRWNAIIEGLAASETDSPLASSGMSHTFAQFGRSGCSNCSRSTAGRQTPAWLLQDVSTKPEAGVRGFPVMRETEVKTILDRQPSPCAQLYMHDIRW